MKREFIVGTDRALAELEAGSWACLMPEVAGGFLAFESFSDYKQWKKRQNIRFWVYHKGSYVKLTMRPDQRITTYHGGPTDEGYSFEEISYKYYEEGVVTKDTASGGRDCDGEHRYYWEESCKVKNLQVLITYRSTYQTKKYQDDPLIPAWEKVNESQYDQFAEMAGY